MIISLTERALKKLESMELPEHIFPRVDAEMAGGCGVAVNFKLIFDEARPLDTVLEFEGIQIRIDRFTKRYLDEETQIDYSQEEGFIVGEPLVQSACALPFN